MNSGFRGTRVGVNKLTIEGIALSYEIAFISEDGVTHGLMRHSMPAEADPVIAERIDALVTEIINRATAAHFSQPAIDNAGAARAQTPQRPYGIAEALGAAGTESDEPEGSQG